MTMKARTSCMVRQTTTTRRVVTRATNKQAPKQVSTNTTKKNQQQQHTHTVVLPLSRINKEPFWRKNNNNNDNDDPFYFSRGNTFTNLTWFRNVFCFCYIIFFVIQESRREFARQAAFLAAAAVFTVAKVPEATAAEEIPEKLRKKLCANNATHKICFGK